MITNQIFDFSRFGAYMRKYVAENRSQLLTLGALALFLPMVLVNLTIYAFGWGTWLPTFNLPGYDFNWRYEVLFFLVILYILSMISGARLYSSLATKQSRIALFGCPASNLEKSLVPFLIYVVGFFIVAYAGAFLADAVRVWIGRAFFADSMTPAPQFIPFRGLFFIAGNLWDAPTVETYISSPLSNIFFFQAVFILGTTVWPRHSVVKTVIFGMIFNIVVSMLAVWGYFLFFHGHAAIRLENVGVDATAGEVAAVIFSIEAVLTIGLYLLSYFRFKEWEVIQRW